jgi:DNA repair exonuclease SbcCD nuclease subunit
MSRFLHTADWQIGRTYRYFEPDDASALAEARIASVKRVAELAQQHLCDAVLVAGDVFDMQGVSERLIRQTVNAMAGFTGPWVLLPGNHDAALSESVWSRLQRLNILPANVHLALTPEPLLLEQARLAILPSPLTQRHTYDDTTGWFNHAETPDGWLRIGLAHGVMQGVLAEGIDSANPIAADRAQQARLDYLALGDWHGCKQIQPNVWYSGTHEPERFVNNDPGYALLVDIAAPGAAPQVTRLETASHRWFALEQTLAVSSDIDHLQQQLQALPDQSVCRLKLSGNTSLADEQRLLALIQAQHARLRALQVDRSNLQLQASDEDIASLQASGYLAEVIDSLRQQAEAQAGDTAADALRILAGILQSQGRGAQG